MVIKPLPIGVADARVTTVPLGDFSSRSPWIDALQIPLCDLDEERQVVRAARGPRGEEL